MPMTNYATDDHLEVNLWSCVVQVSSAEVQKATVRQRIFQDTVKSVALHPSLSCLCWCQPLNLQWLMYWVLNTSFPIQIRAACTTGHVSMGRSVFLFLNSFAHCPLAKGLSCPLWLDRKLLQSNNFPLWDDDMYCDFSAGLLLLI